MICFFFSAIQHVQETENNLMPDVFIHPPVDDDDTKST
jgi:hypothetical protein